MFNWFRRQKVQPEQEQAPPAPVEETPGGNQSGRVFRLGQKSL